MWPTAAGCHTSEPIVYFRSHFEAELQFLLYKLLLNMGYSSLTLLDNSTTGKQIRLLHRQPERNQGAGSVHTHQQKRKGM